MKKTLSAIVTTSQVNMRLDVFAHIATGLSRTFIQEQISKGHLQVNGQKARKPSQKIQLNDAITGVLVDEDDLALEPIPGPLDILYEDENILCINKPQDLVVHPASGYRGATLVHYLLHHFRNHPQFRQDFEESSRGRPGIVHRLDRYTSGVLLVAANRQTVERLSRLFKSRQIEKCYEAVVWGKSPPTLHFENSIGRDKKNRKKMSSNTERGRTAVTDLTLASASSHFSHVILKPKTGRTHQLRVHLSEKGLPVVGDTLYGPKSIPSRVARLNPILRAAVEAQTQTLLHAKSLKFLHPYTGTEMFLEAPRPEVFDKFLSLMKAFDQ